MLLLEVPCGCGPCGCPHRVAPRVLVRPVAVAWLCFAVAAGSFSGVRVQADESISPAARLARGIERLDAGEAESAIDDFDAVTAVKGNDPELVKLRADAFAQRSRALYDLGRFLEAIDSAYFATLEQPEHFDAHFNRGLAYLVRREWDKAIRCFDQALATRKDSAAALSHRGYARTRRGWHGGGLDDQNKAIELDPKLAIAYQRRAAARAVKAAKPADYMEVVKDIEQALTIDPGLAEALCDRAILWRMQGKPDRAAADAEAAVQADPGLARGHFLLGVARLESKDHESAARCFAEAARLDPLDADIAFGLGQAELAREEYAAAEDAFSRTLEINDRHLEAVKGRAAARRKLDRPEEAREDMARARELTKALAPIKSDGRKRSTASSKQPPQPPRFLVESRPVDPALLESARESAGRIDALVAANHTLHGIVPMPRTTDEQFVRRIHLDVVGRIPTLRETNAFLAATDPDKRAKLIDTLLSSDGYASHAFNTWADVLRYRDRPAGDVRAEPFRQWLKQSLAEDKPWNEIVYEMLAAEGHIWDHPATGYLQRDPGMPLDNVNNSIRIFLGTRIGCAQCHDHPFDKWTQRQFYEVAAFVFGTKTRASGGDRRFWMANPNDRLRREYVAIEQEEEDRRRRSYQFDTMLRKNMMIVNDDANQRITLPAGYAYDNGKPGEIIEPRALFGPDMVRRDDETPRQCFARWVTAADNPRFALTIANRLWKQAFGVGQIEPVDDMTDGTVAENPELMAHLELEMKRVGFRMKEFLRILFNSESYQRQASNVERSLGAPYHVPGPVLRRMTAEQAWDSFITLAVANWDYREPPASLYAEAVTVDLDTASAAEVLEAQRRVEQFDRDRREWEKPFLYKGQLLARASELPSPVPPNHFLRIFGQSDRELISASATSGSVPQVLFMYNGPISHMLLETHSTIYDNIVQKRTVSDGVRTVFRTILSREPSVEELQEAVAQVKGDGPAGYGNVVWALVNTREFLFIQ